MKKIGDALQDSTATLIVIGKSKLEEILKDATKHSVKQFEKELNIDVEAFDKALTEAVNESLQER